MLKENGTPGLHKKRGKLAGKALKQRDVKPKHGTDLSVTIRIFNESHSRS